MAEASEPTSVEAAAVNPPTVSTPAEASTSTLEQGSALSLAVESNTSSTPPSAPLSKNAQKRLLKAQAAAAMKLERRAKEREKKKEKRKRIREENEPEQARALLKRKKAPDAKDQRVFESEVCVDLGWDELMNDREIKSLTSQLGFVYASNRGSVTPFSRIVLSGPGPISGYAYAVEAARTSGRKVQEKPTQEGVGADVPLAKTLVGRKLANAGWGKWKRCVRVDTGGLEGLVAKAEEVKEESVAQGEGEQVASTSAAPEQKASSSTDKAQAQAESKPSYKPEDIIYLSADTDETLSELETGKLYVIGGIVDRNRHKNICSLKARKMGVRLARLPIDEEHLGDRALHPRTVLTVNQVFDILLGWVETRDWALALDRGLPHRKTLKDEEKDAKRRRVGTAEQEEEEADEHEEKGEGDDAGELDEEELFNQAQARKAAAAAATPEAEAEA